MHSNLVLEARFLSVREGSQQRASDAGRIVNFPGISSQLLSEELAKLGFGVWSHGSYYALGLHDRIGWGEALRIGIAHYNTLAEIDQFNEALAGLVAAQSPTAARLQ